MHRLLCLCCLVLVSCAGFPNRPPTVYKIALVAPFEGRRRQIGYDAFPALRLAIRERIAATSGLTPQVSFVAYNDNADPAFATQVAGNVAIDPQVLLVIGHLITPTTEAALPIYRRANLAVLTLDESATNCAQRIYHFAASAEQVAQAQPIIAARFQAVSGGPPPGPGSIMAYLAAQQALQAISAATIADGLPTRDSVAQTLARQMGCA